MDRRAFLQILAAVGVLAGAPTWLRDPRTAEAFAPGIALPDDDDVSEWLGPTDLAVYGREKTFDFMASYGLEPTSEQPLGAQLADIFLKRFPEDGGGTLLRFKMLPGQVVRWVAVRGEEIYGPIRIVVPELVQAHVVGTDARGRTVMASKDGVFPLRLD